MAVGALEQPWKPDDFTIALLVALLSLICWGSWSNTAKAASYLPFPYYYLDFCLGVVLSSVVFWATLGVHWVAAEPYFDSQRETLEWIHDARWKITAACGSGSVFSIANLLLVVAIQIAGLSMAFPVGIGTALVLGTVLTYFIDEKGDPVFLFSGVALGVLAILSQAYAYNLKDRVAPDQGKEISPLLVKDTEVLNEPKIVQRSTKFKLTLCIICGILMGLWNPLAAYSREGDYAMTTYGSFLVFCAAVGILSPLLLIIQNAGILIPRVGQRVRLLDYFKLKTYDHIWGLVGGAVWTVGTLSNLVSGDELGFAVSYAIGQSAPLVASLWGLLYYKEFEGSPKNVYWFLALMFSLYSGAVAVIAVGGS